MQMNHRTRKRLTAALGVVAFSAVALLPALRADAATTVTRISGANRYATAAAVSAANFPGDAGVPVAYLATGTNFPDALAGGAAAAKKDAPVLLTQASTLPAETKTELERLKPQKIVVLGGPSIIGASVFDQLDELATDGTDDVKRIAGTDRYDTAAKLSADTFPADVDTVFVATGVNFPDALAAAPAAAASAGGGGPLLLVQQNVIPETTKTELTRLSAAKIVLVGGTQAVSDSVKTALEAYTDGDGPVTRVFGADRYLTAVELSKLAFPSGTERAYLATGLNFPDALAGAAGIADATTPGPAGPMLLTRPDCIQPEVNAEITRLDPDSLVALGGTEALSNAVTSRTVCGAGTSTTSTTTGNA